MTTAPDPVLEDLTEEDLDALLAPVADPDDEAPEPEDQHEDRTIHRRPGGWAAPSLDEDHRNAHRRLIAALSELTEHRRRVPCLDAPVYGDEDELTVAAWLEEDLDDQARAAAACRTCPALTDCALYALSHPEPAGVWGAMTPDDRAAHTTDPQE